MNKRDLRKSILRMDPSDMLAKDLEAGHAALMERHRVLSVKARSEILNELRELDPRHRMLTGKTASYEALAEAVVELRGSLKAAENRTEVEAEALQLLSAQWAYRAVGPPVGTVSTAGRPPAVGDRIPTGHIDGMTVFAKVARVRPWAVVVAGDLPELERLDPRRVWETPNGTSVVYKRQDGPMIVLWSYKSQGEIKVGRGMVVLATDHSAEPTALTGSKRMTQRILAAFLIAENPQITASELGTALKAAFPGHTIGRRHGAHYLSHSRCGRLPEAPATDPRGWIKS